MYSGEELSLFLELRQIKAVHAPPEEVKYLFLNILDEYGIRKSNFMKSLFFLTDILGLPFACHLLNKLFKSLLKPSQLMIDQICSEIHCLKSSTCYAFIRDEFTDLHIASYSDIKWVSLYYCFKTLKSVKILSMHFMI